MFFNYKLFLFLIVYFEMSSNLFGVGFNSLTHIGNAKLLSSPENKKYYGISGTKLLNLFKEIYKSFAPYLNQVYTKYRIPKKIHQIWLGGELPERYKKWQKKIIKLHPTWEYKLWTDQDLINFKLENKLIFDKAKNYGAKADILRYEILYQQGGVYLDCDVECMTSMDNLNKAFDFYAGLEPFWATSDTKALSVGNAIIGCSPGHPIMLSCIQNIKIFDLLKLELPKKTRTVIKTGPVLFTKSCYDNLKKTILGQRNIIFPSKLFYPNLLSPDLNIDPFFKHYWTHSWFKHEKLSIKDFEIINTKNLK